MNRQTFLDIQTGGQVNRQTFIDTDRRSDEQADISRHTDTHTEFVSAQGKTYLTNMHRMQVSQTRASCTTPLLSIVS